MDHGIVPEIAEWQAEIIEDGIAMNTAAQLRRLHLENEENERVIKVWRRRTQQAEAQRDELLEALEDYEQEKINDVHH